LAAQADRRARRHGVRGGGINRVDRSHHEQSFPARSADA
jgi:hypothetical protein